MKNEFVIDLVFKSKVTGEYYLGNKSLITGNYEIFIGKDKKGYEQKITIYPTNKKLLKDLHLELVEGMITLEGVG